MHNFDPQKLTNDVEELRASVAQLLPLIPFIGPIQEMFNRDVAGTGATEAMNIPIPAEEFAKSSITEMQGQNAQAIQAQDHGEL